MNNRKWIVFVAATLALGCSKQATVSHDPESAIRIVDKGALEAMTTSADSAAALYALGDITDFVAVRDSLRLQANALEAVYPEIVYEPEFQKLLNALKELDGLDESNNLPFVSETDSLALAAEQWPPADSTTVDPPAAAFGDTIFPTLENDRIDFWIRYFTGPGKERFQRVLYRMQLYRPLVTQILDEKELPEELIAVAMIESGFVLKARSRAAAVGPWQFIRGTARIYGMRVNWWYDERRDIVASTYAAGNYLSDLYNIWNSWPLALAGYNCGEYRVARAVARHKTQNFWKLRLPKQTERYVPKFLATLYILRDPARYGFTMPEVEPVAYDRVTIKDATDLKVIAKAAGVTMDELKQMNPSLLRWTTPPKMEIQINVPTGAGEKTTANLEAIPPGERVTWRRHRIRQGETLGVIARGYGTSITALKQLNGIRNAHRIRAGKYLVVPVQGSDGEVASTTKPQYKTKRRNISREQLEKYASRYAPPKNHKMVIYRVKQRDTLGEIAELYKTRASKIRSWNNLAYRSYIYPGQKLRIYVPESFADKVASGSASSSKPTTTDHERIDYVIRKGDTIYSISKRFNVSMSDVLAWNNKTRRSKIYPGQKLEIYKEK